MRFETQLDLGDIGIVPATVEGTVLETDLFDAGYGRRDYIRPVIEVVYIRIQGAEIKFPVPLLTKAAQASLEDELKGIYESNPNQGEFSERR